MSLVSSVHSVTHINNIFASNNSYALVCADILFKFNVKKNSINCIFAACSDTLASVCTVQCTEAISTVGYCEGRMCANFPHILIRVIVISLVVLMLFDAGCICAVGVTDKMVLITNSKEVGYLVHHHHYCHHHSIFTMTTVIK